MPVAAHSPRLAFIGMDAATRSTLQELRPLIMRVLPGILDEFYAHIGTYPEVARLFLNQAAMRHAKDMQIKHWDLIAQAQFDDVYFTSVTRVGQTHHRFGLEPQWYIGGYNFILAALLRMIALEDEVGWFGRTNHARRTTKANQTAAITKAALLDMELALAAYIDTGIRAKQELLDTLLNASFRRAIETVSTVSEQFEGTAGSLVQTATSTIGLADTVANAFEQVASGVQTIALASDRLAVSSTDIAQQVKKSNSIAALAVRQAEKSNASISTLSKSATQIGSAVTLISAIAKQTNMLALNAAIEAARAGAAGRGFAVVAQEVKALAHETAEATEEIGRQITQIEAATRDSIAEINEIFATIRRASEISTAIAATLEHQDLSTQEIASSVKNIAQGTSEVAINLGGVTAEAMNTGAVSDQLLTSARALAGESQRLKNEVESFLATARVA